MVKNVKPCSLVKETNISKKNKSVHLQSTSLVNSGNSSVLTQDNVQYISTKPHGATPRLYCHGHCRETHKAHNR